MGADPEARLTYGYDLGTYEKFKAAEVSAYDSPNLPWYRTDLYYDDPGYADGDFIEALYQALYKAIPDPPPAEDEYDRKSAAEKHFGVQVEYSGAESSIGWVLTIKDEDANRSVEWSDTIALDLGVLSMLPLVGDWDAKLSRALIALGITPTQDQPRWLVFPYYG